jgi:hypothetical protein
MVTRHKKDAGAKKGRDQELTLALLVSNLKQFVSI